ncbi:metal-nicotianamine transporter-like protein [Raphidocelis subcapitata]|uniref:Metal-nicotianamine transporter-like protein n=1 Tax=Raphidocelis subcapitata TaxID=307507 RepID=A0A2V0NTS7_9CHLO|nr:metal-nicotianamine transporter-like protein [Raphidocelis subcapitata]|eukprot:GBF88235.1 metal-nicotianamine transporter-like protein [Raphidocelis subcapitata]
MGTAPEPGDGLSGASHAVTADSVQKRHPRAQGEAPVADAHATLVKDPSTGETKGDDIDATLDELPKWTSQLSLRGYIVGTALGALFTIISLKLTLGTAGIIPSLNIPGGLISFAAIKSITTAGTSLRLSQRAPRLHSLLFQPFGLQENAVMQTYILSMGAGGFGSYLTGMGYQAYRNLGGAPRDSPDFDPSAVYDPVPTHTMPYLVLTTVLGAFMLTQLRRLMIIEWRLPFPSGTASGIMLTSFHTANGASEAIRKVKVLSFTGLCSFAFSVFKWFFQGTDYGCGFTAWPTFGFAAMKYTWNFDWQLNYVGAGMICPHIVNWSMLFGAILSWGFMWPMLQKREGDWYPAGLGPHDFQGIFGYKVFLVISILMGEGLYMVLRVLVSSGKDTAKRVREVRAARRLPKFHASGESRAELLEDSLQPTSSGIGAAAAGAAAPDVLSQHVPPVMADGLPVDKEDQSDENEALISFKETPQERRLRTALFLRETIPWWMGPTGYVTLAVLSTIFIPMVYTPVKWYYVLVAYIVTPLFALPNSYGCGLTDWDMSSMYAKLALFIFAAWAGVEGNGVIVGLGICGVVLSATSSAATLMGDLRTGYICLASPRAMFAAQLVGQLVGAVLTPLAFMLFYKTGQVNVPGGPYPAPFADIYRGMAEIGTKGFGALPKYCTVLMGTFFAAGILISLIRDLMPKKWGKWIPSPMAMSIPFYIGAASAIDFWLGSMVMHIWEFISPAAAEALGPTVGAGLLVGDGLWSIPSSILAIVGRAPPVCMGFLPRGPKCGLPYCMAFWRGGSGGAPH